MITKRSILGALFALAVLVGAGPRLAAPVHAQDANTDGMPMTTITAADIVERVGPSVVTVVSEIDATTGEGGSGTGFIIDDAGHIVTNWHVVTGGTTYTVILANGEVRDATLIGSDEVSDLAVIQVEGDLPGIATWGDSSMLRPGEPVLAIGSPLGSFTNTVTQGIVSAIDRDFEGSTYFDLIQHDAAINPGNSGGPLFDFNGNVIGVNTLGIPSENGDPVQGLFFALPGNSVQTVVQKLIETGSVTYPYFGVGFQPVTTRIAGAYDLPVDYGVIVTEVVPGGPADAGGILVDDIILAVGGIEVTQTDSFPEVLFNYNPGDTVDVTVQRGNEQVSLQVTLGTRPPGA